MERPQEHQRLMELIGLVRDGGLDDSQTSELEHILENDPAALQYYVEAIDVTSMLHRQQGMIDADQDTSQPSVVMPSSVMPVNRGWWPIVYWSAAICASLAVGVLLGGQWFQVDDPANSIRNAVTTQVGHSESEIATLSFAAGCRWDLDDQPRYEGQRLRAETLRLEEGVAVVQFDSDVRLVLEGPSELELASVDHAMLRHGKVVFSGEGDLDHFTLETPFSKIQDEGTEFAVSVDRSGATGEVHVFDGRVICEPSGQKLNGSGDQLIHIHAGDARRISQTGATETIELASNRFIRQPAVQSEPANSIRVVEHFDYDTGPLAGSNGGRGWLQGWKQAERSKMESDAPVRIGESLVWPHQDKSPIGGSITINGSANLGRMLQDPIHMNRDAAYYISFLVRRDSVPEGADSNGWAYFTLRNAQESFGKISIGPVTQRGKPRIIHNGRVANATSPLREKVVYLFVCKILARQEKDDLIDVRIYGDHETVDSVEPSIWNISSRPIRNDSVLNEFRVSTKNMAPIQFDELRIGKTWASVTAAYSR